MSARTFTVALGVSAVAGTDPSMAIHKDPDFPAFQRFITSFRGGVGYSSEFETLARFQALKTNLRNAERRNAIPGTKAKHGVTKFMDLTADEFKQTFLGLQPPSKALDDKMKAKDHMVPVNYTAASINWADKGAVTPVKNQGQCGSCWAFSATEQLESQYFQTFGELKELSPQQVTSCDTSCGGCNGGNPVNAWFYVEGFGGQDSETSYPYTSGVTRQTGVCDASTTVIEDVGDSVGYYISRIPAQESNMLAQIEESPMSVCVDAELWQTYTGGIITASDGCGTTIDHAVQATGYEANGNYWLVRNSWGADFGEAGYVYVEAGSNVCGIASQATITDPALVAKAGKYLAAK